MAFTGVPGTADSRPGNLVPGYVPAGVPAVGITVVASAFATTGATATATTAAIDTTGAKLIELTLCYYNTTVTPTDSKGNTWIPLTESAETTGGVRIRKYYCLNPTVGSGHTFTITAAATIYGGIFVRAYGASTGLQFVSEATAAASPGTVTSLAAGTVTPPANGCLVTTGLMLGSSGPSGLSVSGGGLAAITTVNFASGTSFAQGYGDEIQTTAAARTPVWAWTTSSLAVACTALYQELPAGVVAQVDAGYTSAGSGATTAAVDTTGATLIELTIASAGSSPPPAVSDSKSNTWIPLTAQVSSSDCRVQKFFAYCSASGKNGAGHTFTIVDAGAWAYARILVRAYSGGLVYQSEAGTTVTGATTISTGSVTPPGTGALVTSGLAWNASIGSVAVSGGSPPLTIVAARQPVGSTNIGGAYADTVQGAVAAVSPTWTWTGATAMAGVTACYHPSAAPASSIARVASTQVSNLGPGTSATSPAINTTGATLIEVNVTCGKNATVTITDSKGNTWTPLTIATAFFYGLSLYRFYALCGASGKNGAGHTVSITGTNTNYAATTIVAYSGVAGLLAQSAGGNTDSGTSVAAGLVTPTQINCLVTCGWGSNEGLSALAVSAGLTIVESLPSAAALNYAVAVAELIQSRPAIGVNPTWTWTTARPGASVAAVYSELAPAAATALRVSQVAVETLSTASAPNPLRISQVAVETLSTQGGSAGARISQVAVETLTPRVPPPSVVTQLVVETITPRPVPRVTQVAVETLTPIPPSPGQVTQIPVETLSYQNPPALVTQTPVEHVTQWDAPLVIGQVTQVPVEHTWQRPAIAVLGQATQIPIEIIYPFGCFKPLCILGEFPVDDVPAGGSCPAPIVP